MTADPATATPKFGFVAPRLTAGLFALWVIVQRPDLGTEWRHILGVLLFGLVLVTIVTVHEYGHYLVGSSFGLDLYVRVGPLFGYCAPSATTRTSTPGSPRPSASPSTSAVRRPTC